MLTHQLKAFAECLPPDDVRELGELADVKHLTTYTDRIHAAYRVLQGRNPTIRPPCEGIHGVQLLVDAVVDL